MKHMKKIALSLIVLMSSITIFCQTQKGNFVLSGNTSIEFINNNIKYVYDGQTQGKLKTNSFLFSPSFGYFVIDNLSIGLSSNISFETTKMDGDKTSSKSFSVLPTTSYYFSLNEKIKPSVRLGIGYASIITKSDGSEKSSYNGIAFGFGGGVSYFINKNISFNLGLSYTRSNLKNEDNDKMKVKLGEFDSKIGISVFL
jgi:outer membrane protein